MTALFDPQSSLPSAAGEAEAGVDASLPRVQRVLLVDDSLVVRSVLERILRSHSGFDVVASVDNVGKAMQALDAMAVDIIILDIEMPGGSGLDALPDLLARSGAARVLVLSSLCAQGGEQAMRALALGAHDTLEKPSRGRLAGAFEQELLRRLGCDHVPIGHDPAPRSAPTARLPEIAARAVDCIAIGASTGGIPALHALFAELDHAISAPILITQHLPHGFMPFLARQLSQSSGRAVQVARNGQQLEAGDIILASGEAHLALRRIGGGIRIAFDTGQDHGAYYPAVDPMMESVAACYGEGAVAVILSGMGRDGLIGCGAIARAGGYILAQDSASSTIWGMPGAIVRANLARHCLPAAQIGRAINRMTGAAPGAAA